MQTAPCAAACSVRDGLHHNRTPTQGCSQQLGLRESREPTLVASGAQLTPVMWPRMTGTPDLIAAFAAEEPLQPRCKQASSCVATSAVYRRHATAGRLWCCLCCMLLQGLRTCCGSCGSTGRSRRATASARPPPRPPPGLSARAAGAPPPSPALQRQRATASSDVRGFDLKNQARRGQVIISAATMARGLLSGEVRVRVRHRTGRFGSDEVAIHRAIQRGH